MSESSRIPRSMDGFNGYITTTVAYLQAGTPTTNASRLGITEEEVKQWESFGNEWNPLYAMYVDKKNSRTTTIKDRMLEIISNTTAYDQDNHILDRIAVSTNATIVDFSTFRIKEGSLKKSGRTLPQTAISEPVEPTLQPIGGGKLTIKCYSTTGKRAAIYDIADSVQYLYKVGSPQPVSADDESLNIGLSTKASFMLSLGASASAQMLYIYFRWYNTKHPELSGPWCTLQSILIL